MAATATLQRATTSAYYVWISEPTSIEERRRLLLQRLHLPVAFPDSQLASTSCSSDVQRCRRCLVLDNFGKPAIIAPDSINPWWSLLEEAVKSAGNKLGKLEIFPASTNSCYFRQIRLPAFGFSSMTNTPILLHETMTIMWFVSLVLVWPSDAIKFLSKNEYLKGIGIYEPIIYRSNLLILKDIFRTAVTLQIPTDSDKTCEVGKSSYANEKGKMKWNSNFGGRTSVKT
ncbi:Aminoacylase-1 [Zea mays]|uniref:Aminoacylase-1 n=1 Tax=Zea mays TaxID=4577 RepID=A0A3L6G410_MAIZE|nr:Aminoacylase-1 [Zea mays]